MHNHVSSIQVRVAGARSRAPPGEFLPGENPAIISSNRRSTASVALLDEASSRSKAARSSSVPVPCARSSSVRRRRQLALKMAHAKAGCKWHASATKTVCYYADPSSSGDKGRRLQDFSGATGTYTEKVPNWVIVDRLVAPVVEGRYVLQWRWDNDQTPQIWTTCSDVIVTAESASLQWWWVVVPVLSAGLAVAAVVVAAKAIRRSRGKATPMTNPSGPSGSTL